MNDEQSRFLLIGFLAFQCHTKPPIVPEYYIIKLIAVVYFGPKLNSKVNLAFR